MIATVRRDLVQFLVKRESKLSIVILLSLILGGIMLETHLAKTENSSLRLGYSFFGSIKDIDPIEIQSIYQSNIIENLYSRLIEYDNAGQIICSLCSSFSIDGNTIKFSFNNPTRTHDGKIVDAEDAKISINRIASSQTNTHGSLKYYLDPNSRESVKVDSGQLVITVAHDQWVPFVLSLLTSMDFSVIPKGSFDADGKIVDYKNTSGAYHVSSSDEAGHLHLRVNLNHARYQSSMIDEIFFVPIKSGEAKDAFANGSIDMIDPTYYAYDDDINQILKSIPNAHLHKTLQIGLTSLVFSKKSLVKFSREERLAAAFSIKQWFLNKTPKIYGGEETDQYFQSFGQGFLSAEQKESLKQSENEVKPSKHQFVFGLTEKYRQWIQDYQFPAYIKIEFFKSYPGFLPEDEQPDIYLMTGDSSFDEDISALSYLFSQGIFAFDKESGAHWIQNYMNLGNRDERINRLKDLHYAMLHSVKVFPLISRPYVAISNAKFDMDFPKIYAGSPLWKIWIR